MGTGKESVRRGFNEGTIHRGVGRNGEAPWGSQQWNKVAGHRPQGSKGGSLINEPGERRVHAPCDRSCGFWVEVPKSQGKGGS